MAPELQSEPYKEVLLFLTTAGVVVPLFHRLRISPVLGFLAAGVVLGPFGLGHLAQRLHWLEPLTISHVEQISHVAEFGVVFLLFMIGLELSWERLSRMRHLVFGLGALQVGVCAAGIAGAAVWLGIAGDGPLVVGAALALSSTAIVIPVLAERRRLGSAPGRASFAVLLFQDLAVAPLLVMITVLGSRRGGAQLDLGALAPLLPAAAALVGLVVGGHLVLRPLFRWVAAVRSTELFMAACLLVIVAAATIAARSGLSMGLGAFVAGLLLAETEFRREIEVTIEPFKGLLLGLFFVSVGASLDLTIVVRQPLTMLAMTAGIVALKSTTIFLLARAFRLPDAVAGEASLLLGPGGEFGFVLLAAAASGGVLPSSVARPAFVVVTLSMLTIPALAILGERLGRRGRSAAPPVPVQPPPDDTVARVIIVGYGRVGRLVGEMLVRHGRVYLAIDSDPKVVASERRSGKEIYFGDATRAEFLRRCGVAQAQALVVTMDAPQAVESVVAAARRERPDLTIVARARDTRHAKKLYALGVTDAVPETVEASLQLSEAMLVDLGIPMGLVIASIHEKRDEYRRALNVLGVDPPRFRASRSTRAVRRAPAASRPEPDRRSAPDPPTDPASERS